MLQKLHAIGAHILKNSFYLPDSHQGLQLCTVCRVLHYVILCYSIQNAQIYLSPGSSKQPDSLGLMAVKESRGDRRHRSKLSVSIFLRGASHLSLLIMMPSLAIGMPGMSCTLKSVGISVCVCVCVCLGLSVLIWLPFGFHFCILVSSLHSEPINANYTEKRERVKG